jgi:hypothetical protein
MIIKILKYFLYFGIATLLTVLIWYSNGIYSEYRSLKYLAVSNCIMHDRNTQLCDPVSDISLSFFRRVNLNSGDIIVSYLDSDIENRYQYVIFWKANCSPGTVIDLGRLVPLNMLGGLECIDQSAFFESDGAYVQMKLVSKERINDYISYGGFSASIDFASTDYSILERAINWQCKNTS